MVQSFESTSIGAKSQSFRIPYFSFVLLYAFIATSIKSTTATILTSQIHNSVSASSVSPGSSIARPSQFTVPQSARPPLRSSNSKSRTSSVIETPFSVGSRARSVTFEEPGRTKITVDKLIHNRAVKSRHGLVQNELRSEGRSAKNDFRGGGQIGKMVAERYVVSFRRFITKVEFRSHIERVKQLIRDEIMTKGIRSIDGEMPRITDIMIHDPSPRLPEGFHTYIALLTSTIIEKISTISGIHVLKDFDIKLSFGSINPTFPMNPLTHSISKRAAPSSTQNTPSLGYAGLLNQRLSMKILSDNWGLDRIDQRSSIRDGWYHFHKSSGDGVRVVVMDSGIEPHPHFEDRVLPPVSFVEDSENSTTSSHGTIIASIVGSSKTGVAKKAKLQSYTLVNGNVISYAQILRGMNALSNDVITSRKSGKEKVVVNLSFGFTKTSAAFDLEIGLYNIESLAIVMVENGAVLVKSAGNSGSDECDMVLNRVPEIIHVGAITMDDRKLEESNYGSCVDVFAPGHHVLGYDPELNGYHPGSGTSFAAPHVAGVIALYLSSGHFDNVSDENLAAVIKETLIRNAWTLHGGDLAGIESFEGTFPRIVNSVPKFMYEG
ncbi:peptidase S8/S53 domain-containing protein [Paraphysoderma sedebokerense]|nr:peptidase S8/S53 domain-containing protein [Paraphysoderma sedebokerense]